MSIAVGAAEGEAAVVMTRGWPLWLMTYIVPLACAVVIPPPSKKTEPGAGAVVKKPG